MIGWGQHVPASPDASEPIVSLFFILHAVVQLKLPSLGFVHLATEEDVVGGRGVANRAVVQMMVEVVGLFRESPCGVAALAVCVDWPVVIRTRPVLTAVVAGPAEEQAGFIAIVAAIAATAASRYGVPTAGEATPLLPATPGQENGNERDNQ